ncbi:MAG: DUF3024 domain-containing protein [Coriobacteriia bacterium]|nr:DUF3024 domain-containing protein [Coriobacteriia bacterium]
MAFTEPELQAIHRALEPLSESVPEHVRDRVRIGYEVDGHNVVVFEEHPDWQDPGQWMRSPSARLRYFRSRDEWRLYWMRADLKWHSYEVPPARRLATLVRHVERDEYGCFFG